MTISRYMRADIISNFTFIYQVVCNLTKLCYKIQISISSANYDSNSNDKALCFTLYSLKFIVIKLPDVKDRPKFTTFFDMKRIASKMQICLKVIKNKYNIVKLFTCNYRELPFQQQINYPPRQTYEHHLIQNSSIDCQTCLFLSLFLDYSETS